MDRTIITNKDFLRRRCQPTTVEEGYNIADQLIDVLNKLDLRTRGVGLSANQIGILKSVSVIHVNPQSDPLILINPVITQKSPETFTYLEGCLSLPGKLVTTKRHLKVFVQTLNHANELFFGPDVEPLTQESARKDLGLLQSACVQHEIDHLNGILMSDPSVRYVTEVRNTVKYGRNDKVMVEKNGETQYIKYKRAVELLNEGWKIL